MASAAAYIPAEYHPWFRSEVLDAPKWRKTSPTKGDLARQSRGSGLGDMFLSEKPLMTSDIDYLKEHVGDPPIRKAALRIDAKRLWRDIHHSAQWGAIPNSMGMARLAASGEDGEVRNWFVCEARAIGCEVEIDQIGNIFAILPGLCPDIAPIAMGSHLDTQPAGKPRRTLNAGNR
jgi:hypothetical protein